MRRPVRYVLALVVALALPLGLWAADVDAASPVVYVAIAVVYGPTTSLLLGNPGALRDDESSRTLGAIGGGVGAFGGTALLNVSVPVGVLGFGMLAFGMAVALASTGED